MAKFGLKYSSFMLLALAACLFLFYGSRTGRSGQEESHCFTCHTSARKLIQITRQLARATKDTPEVSVATQGEG